MHKLLSGSVKHQPTPRPVHLPQIRTTARFTMQKKLITGPMSITGRPQQSNASTVELTSSAFLMLNGSKLGLASVTSNGKFQWASQGAH